MTRQALGKGLGALIPVAPQNDIDEGERISQINVEEIFPSRFQPRSVFADGPLAELAESIKEKGVIQPIIVAKKQTGFELIAGERRWRAVKSLGLNKIPAIVRIVRDSDALEMAIIENIQRENLNPIEEAVAYERLLNEFAFTQEQLGVKLGKSRSAVANILRLLKLPNKIKDDLSAGRLSMGSARALLALGSDAERLKLRDEIINAGMNVRDVESSVSAKKEKRGAKKKPAKHIDPNIERVAIALERRLGARVDIADKGKGGVIKISYSDSDELNRILDLTGAL